MTRCGSTATLSSELRHKYNVRSILIRKDGEVQVDHDLSSELRHKYNVRSILIRKDDKVQVDYNPLHGAALQVQCLLHPYPQG